MNLLIQTEVWSAVRPYDPGHRRLALDDVVPQLESDLLWEPLALDNMLLVTPFSVVLAGMLSRLCQRPGQSVCRTLGLYVVWIRVLPMAPPHLPHKWICSTPHGGCIHPFSSLVPRFPQGLQSLLRMMTDRRIGRLRLLRACGDDAGCLHRGPLRRWQGWYFLPPFCDLDLLGTEMRH